MPGPCPIEDRLLTKIVAHPETGCWLWCGCIDRCGYGKVYYRERAETLAHRASYLVFKGGIPAGCEIDHLCGNRSCINPAHLQAVPHSVNVSRADYTRNHRNGRKTHCKRGHELSGVNLVVQKNGARQCRFCINDRARKALSKVA